MRPYPCKNILERSIFKVLIFIKKTNGQGEVGWLVSQYNRIFDEESFGHIEARIQNDLLSEIRIELGVLNRPAQPKSKLGGTNH